jgi:nicotinamide-nucleotide amidase
MTLYHKTVADDEEATARAVREAAAAAPLVILTGGLGPTDDDLTRQAFSRVLRSPLVLHAPSLARIRAFFRSLGREMPPANQVQALCPRGATVLVNFWGTAPGIRARVGRSTVYAFPGVPKEMAPMYERYVLPRLAHGTGRVILTETLHAFGAGESTVASALGELMRRDRNPIVGTTVSDSIVSVRIRSDFPEYEAARRALRATSRAVRRKLGGLVFGKNGQAIQEAVARQLKRSGLRLATAESCTGGLIARMVTDVAGSSGWFVGGWVAYANDLKRSELGVPATMIARKGAVSEEVARAMAEGALRKSGADIALATTGVAGPGGGSAAKPVGTVWIGLARKGKGSVAVRAECFRFPGTRAMVRDRAAKTALNMLRMDLIRLC